METLTGERPTAPSVAESPPAPAARSTPIALLVAMRPPEWIKNLLVFAGLLFSGKLDQGAQVVDATLTFAAFCAIRGNHLYHVHAVEDGLLNRFTLGEGTLDAGYGRQVAPIVGFQHHRNVDSSRVRHVRFPPLSAD